MQTDVLLESNSRGEELRYVTLHYNDLQGLSRAPLWAAFFVIFSVAATNTLSQRSLELMSAATMLPCIGWLFFCRHWYQRRYGVVKAPEISYPSGLISIMHPEVFTDHPANYSDFDPMILLVFALGIIPNIFHTFGPTTDQLGTLVISFVLLPKSRRVTDSHLVRLRRIFARTGALSVLALAIGYLFGPLSKWTYLETTCAILLVSDLYDHWLFTRLLRGPSTEVSS